MSANFANPAQFIRDLDSVSATFDLTQNIEPFFSDLSRVHSQTRTDQYPQHSTLACDLSNMARQFDEVRSNAFEKIGGPQWLDTLPKYDPLRCRVSLFGSLDLGIRETAHTRAIAYLMDPNRDHGFGYILLRTFLMQIFGWNEKSQLTDVEVDSELPSDGGRDRLDIFIKGKRTLIQGKVETWMVIVEAKIAADEGEDQLARYEDQLYKKIAPSDYQALVFLTPDGREPTTGSKGGGLKWTRFSFMKLVAGFRPKLRELCEHPEFGYLRHYMTGVLKDIYLLNCGGFDKRKPDTNELYHICEYLSHESTGGT
jgi:hypothetical protein